MRPVLRVGGQAESTSPACARMRRLSDSRRACITKSTPKSVATMPATSPATAATTVAEMDDRCTAEYVRLALKAASAAGTLTIPPWPPLSLDASAGAPNPEEEPVMACLMPSATAFCRRLAGEAFRSAKSSAATPATTGAACGSTSLSGSWSTGRHRGLDVKQNMK